MGRRYGLCVLALFWSLTSAVRVQAQQGEALQVFEATNQDRAAQGLGPLKWDPALAQAAQAHAELMVQRGSLSHQFPGEPGLAERAAQAGAHFSVIAENVAMGPNPSGLETQWMHSAPHRANILDPRLNALGVGLVKSGIYYYAVEDFADGVAQLGPQQIERRGRSAVASTRCSAVRLGTGCAANLRDAAWSRGRFNAQIHNALGRSGPQPASASAGATTRNRPLPHSGGWRLRLGASWTGIYNLPRGRASLLTC